MISIGQVSSRRCRIELVRQLEPDGHADEHPEPRLLGDAASRTAASALGRVVAPAPPARPASSCASPNQPPSSSASLSTRWSAGRGVGDDLLRVREALGVAERLDGGVDLLGGVGGAVVGHGRAAS